MNPPAWTGTAIFTSALCAGLFLAAHASYNGAVAAGSGPGGWNLHMLIVAPVSVAIGLLMGALGFGIASIVTRRRWLREGIGLLLAPALAWTTSFGIFTWLNSL